MRPRGRRERRSRSSSPRSGPTSSGSNASAPTTTSSRSAGTRLAPRHGASGSTFHRARAGPSLAGRRAAAGPRPRAAAPSRLDLSRVAARFASQVPDRAGAPLFRALLVRVAEREHVLLLGADHILCDGVSLQLIRRELAEGYAATQRGEAIPDPPRIQHLDWAGWQRRLLSGDRLHHLLAAWSRRLGDRRPLLEFPLPGMAPGPGL